MKGIRERMEPMAQVDASMLSLSVLIAASQAISLKRIADALTCSHGDTLADWIAAGVQDRREGKSR